MGREGSLAEQTCSGISDNGKEVKVKRSKVKMSGLRD